MQVQTERGLIFVSDTVASAREAENLGYTYTFYSEMLKAECYSKVAGNCRHFCIVKENSNMYPKEVKVIVDFLNEARAKYPCEVDRNGNITYGNGNDGTDFDWEVNERLCEFGWGVPDGSVWAFKCLINKTGLVEIYCYPNGESSPVDVIKSKLFTEEEVAKLYDIMYESVDAKGIFDPSLCDIEWEVGM